MEAGLPYLVKDPLTDTNLVAKALIKLSKYESSKMASNEGSHFILSKNVLYFLPTKSLAL